VQARTASRARSHDAIDALQRLLAGTDLAVKRTRTESITIVQGSAGPKRLGAELAPGRKQLKR